MDLANHRPDRLLQGALSGLSLRQRVISNNVANATTPGFKKSLVDFESSLKAALARRGGSSGRTPEVTPEVSTSHNTSVGVDGNNVDIDQEMVDLAHTNITYNAMTQLMSARSRSLRSVISDGRR